MGLLTTRIKVGDTSFTHYYLCPYLPLMAGKDTLSLSLLKFKQRIQPHLDAWIAASIEMLAGLSLSPHTIILRALRHDEITPRPEFPSALDLLGQSLATHLHCNYIPTLLSKTRPTLPGKLLTRRGRHHQLLDVYRFTAPPPKPTPAPGTPTLTSAPSPSDHSTPSSIPAPSSPSTPFLLIDDILTTGATMRALIRTLRDHNPICPITTFTLTRADYHPALLQAEATQIPALETLKSQIFANTV